MSEICQICKYPRFAGRVHAWCKEGKNLQKFTVKTLAGDLIVIDIDPADGGMALRQKIYEKHPEFPVMRQALVYKPDGGESSRRIMKASSDDVIGLFIQSDDIEETCAPESYVYDYPGKPTVYKMTYNADDVWADGIGKMQIFSKEVDGKYVWSSVSGSDEWFNSIEEMFEDYRKTYKQITDRQIENLIHLWWVYN
uniref:Uncharacterized protein n=1 Tax=viral metagenome TaxID=1070528 RepID=A0A6C0KFN0_9ZZZZ